MAFLIGAAKSGTSHLAARLGLHSQICLTEPKEPCFFSEDELYAQGLGWYRSRFEASDPGDLVFLDGTTQYSRCTVFPDVPKRIHAHFPNARLIYMLRDPVDRAFSHYTHRWLKEVHPGEPFSETFEEFVLKDKMCLDDSRYQMQYEHYLPFFPEDRFLILTADELRSDFEGTVRRVCQHLDIPFETLPEAESEKSNVTSQFVEDMAKSTVVERIKKMPLVETVRHFVPKRIRQDIIDNIIPRTSAYEQVNEELTPEPMRDDTRPRLIAEFESDIAWAERMVGRSLDAWRS